MADNAAIAFLKGILGGQQPPPPPEGGVDPERPWDSPVLQKPSMGAPTMPPAAMTPTPPSPEQPVEEALRRAMELEERNKMLAPYAGMANPGEVR